MELSQEDSLRLNVLLRQDLQAIRIDESAMMLHALTVKGEAKINLNPTCRDDKYLRGVREMLSTHVLGTPGGYPIFLKRWTRMGQMRDESLGGLLLLGEPEAVVAVAHAPGLTGEMARKAWWVMPVADIARRMLENKEVATSEFGKELASFLIEFLPFESDAQAVLDTVKLVLQPGLISEAQLQGLWKKGARKSAYHVGFLLAIPNDLPDNQSVYNKPLPFQFDLQALVDEHNWYARQFAKVMSDSGQLFLSTVESTIGKLTNQDVSSALFDAIGDYFSGYEWCLGHNVRAWKELQILVGEYMTQAPSLSCQKMLATMPAQKPVLEAMLSLALVSEHLLIPIFAQSDAEGSVMRKKLLPVTEPLLALIKQLRTD